MSEEVSANVSATIAKLPIELQSILDRKCSGDLTTRFTSKIESLLAFV
jgi:hypothetical protein